MTRTLINKLLPFVLILITFSASAQEQLFDLNGNARLNDYEIYMPQSDRFEKAASGDTLDLPVFDDFSEPFSRLRHYYSDVYPDSDIWDGNTVYINNHMAINPISQGVATFDGLDERGRAYSFGFATPNVADSLTSHCVRLGNAADTVYLSFYYQAQGLGNAPEQDNPLVVEFKDTAQTWTQVWDAEGYELEDFDFRRAMIPITDERYLFDGFQFRFMNYASLSGNVDHWHLDYVELDEGRTQADTIIKDVSQLSQTSWLPDIFVNQVSTVSLLKEYSSMPWEHYKEDPEGFMGDTAFTVLRNNDTTEIPTNFSLQILDHQGTQLFDVLSATAPVFPGRICGNESNNCNVIGGSSNLLSDISSSVTMFDTNSQITSDSSRFELRFSLGVDDDLDINDIRVESQDFYNYYAYDDGTAEQAYGLGELENVGRVAVKYHIKKEDILRSIQLYLNPVAFDLSNEPVQLAVWYGNDEPEDTLWTSPSLNLNYTDHINYFYHYFLDREIQVNANSNIFVGWIQQPATNQKFSIGFDKRSNNNDKAFYNLGTTWNQSSIQGSIMIRPVFGQAYDWVGISETERQELQIYPNPTTGQLFIQEQFAGQLQSSSIRVFDMSGREVFQQIGYDGALNLKDLHEGVYLVRVETETNVFTQRLVLQ